MIRLEGITKKYIGKYVHTEALKGVDLKVEEGEFIAIMGRSGTGKTTLLNLLGCMDRFNEGEYYFNDVNVSKLNDKQVAKFRNKNIGFIFQSFNLVPDLTALDNIELPLGLAGVPTKSRKDRAFRLLKEIGLEDKMYHRPLELSGGQQQRVAIARALANQPQMLLADEPTGNLDEESGVQIMEYLKQINMKERVTIIMVTHDPIVSQYADYVLEMKDGKIYKSHVISNEV